MKNKKSLLSLGLLALVLVLGVGYAVVSSQDLTITGTAETAEDTLTVWFESVGEVTDKTANVEAEGTVNEQNKLEATIEVTGLAAVGDYVVVPYVVANGEKDLAASLIKKEITVLSDEGADLSSYYTVTTDVDTTAIVIPNGDGANYGSETVNVRVQLAKLPITDDESKANITIIFTASPVQPAQSQS